MEYGESTSEKVPFILQILDCICWLRRGSDCWARALPPLLYRVSSALWIVPGSNWKISTRLPPPPHTQWVANDPLPPHSFAQAPGMCPVGDQAWHVGSWILAMISAGLRAATASSTTWRLCPGLRTFQWLTQPGTRELGLQPSSDLGSIALS